MLIAKVCEIKKTGQKYITIPKRHPLYNAKYVEVNDAAKEGNER